MNILGLQFGHDAGIAVLSDGLPVTNMIRERHNRAKHAFGINVSHIEQSLAQSELTVEDIDMVAVTSNQVYELVVVDQPDQLQIEYQPHPDVKIASSLYDVLIQDGISVEDRLVGQILNKRIYSQVSQNPKNVQYFHDMFPERRHVKKEDLGITGFLSDYISSPMWETEMGLSDIANLDIKPILKNEDFRTGLHYPITVILKNRRIPAVIVQHHAAHAASTFYTSRSKQAAVFTHDGGIHQVGPNNGMIFYGEENRLLPIVPNHIAVGDLYDKVGIFLGFDMSGSAGKLMGLAPYGKPRFFHRKMVGNTYDLRRNGIAEPHKMWLAHCKEMAESFGYDLSPLGDVDRVLESVCVDIAASTQKLFEETILAAVEAVSGMFSLAGMPMDTLCYSGGTALNCPTNSRLFAESPFQMIHITPHCDDSGLSLGAAQYLYHNVLDKPRREQSPKTIKEFPYLGFLYGEEVVESALHAVRDKIHVQQLPDSARQAAQDLDNDRIIGWFEGRSEIGPRALGHRSLLANPKHGANWERMNELKSREKWRPFAPAVLEEDADSYFRGHPDESSYMLYTAQVCTTDLPAITHVDGSARIQTVTAETGGLFEVLKYFKEISGCAVVLNTSFNGPGEPIVERPEEALDFLLATNLDVLYLDGYQITRRR